MNMTEHNVGSAADIAPDGDVILLVGPEKTELRVHSQCLRAASSVFNVMFGPNFREGQGLSNLSPACVPLPEDNAKAFRTICCIIHHRNDDVPPALAATDILEIAIASEKFDLAIALKYARAQWLKPQDQMSLLDAGYLMTAAYLFDDTGAFMANSLALILDYSQSYLELLCDKTMSQFMPQKTFQERRTTMRADLSRLITEGKNQTCSCEWCQQTRPQYSLIAATYGPSEILKIPMSEIVSRMEKIPTEDLQQKRQPEEEVLLWEKDHSLGQVETLLERVQEAKKRASLCVDCVRSNSDRRRCRARHM